MTDRPAEQATDRPSLAVPSPSYDPVVERYKQDVDRTLLRENLTKSVDERLRTLAEWQEATRELQRATRDVRPEAEVTRLEVLQEEIDDPSS